MARTWLVDSRGIARKVKNATLPCVYQIKDCGAHRECPNCHYHIDNNDASYEWPGLPAGVKFDPSDLELVEHLAAKCGVGNLEPHMFIDEFIPTLEEVNGICCNHPENLPGAKKDGSSVHFFHRTRNAYATGQRKRRKIDSQQSSTKESVRWHKTGKTKPVMENGVQRGFKKIMVLYGTSVKGSKPDKSNWVMHQYHLGTDEDEKQGEYVVSKIFYQQQKQSEKNENPVIVEEADTGVLSRTSPMTPKTNDTNPPRPGKFVSSDGVTDDFAIQLPRQEVDPEQYPSCLAGESQAADENGIDDPLLCKEILESYTPLDDSHGSLSAFFRNTNDGPGADGSGSFGFSDLENIELDTPPDLADLQFGSQDSIFGWIDRL
ncbi:hypothetical protein LguiB_011383 [Lonicera macranthoides]